MVPNSFHTPFHVVSRARHEIIYTPNNTCVGYIRYQAQYDEFRPLLNEDGVFIDIDLDYSEGYSLFSILTALDRTLNTLSVHPEGDTGRYRLWILRYGEHYVVIEMNYCKLRECIREHQFLIAFNKGNTYETISRRRHG